VNSRVHEINRQFTDNYKAATMQAFETDLAIRLKGISKAKKARFLEDRL